MTRKNIFILVGVLALVLTPVVLRLARGGEVKQVEIETVSRKVISPTILASGSLTYQTEIKMVSEVMGRVQELRVKEGDLVQKGDMLLRLDPATSLAEVAQLEALVQQSRYSIERQRVSESTLDTKWKRYQQLREQGVIDANSYDDVRSQRDLARVEVNSSGQALRQTEAQLKQARERLAKTELRSPISGRVTALTIKIGETAVPSVTSIAGSDLMVVADTSNLFAEVNVNETDVARVTVGQEAQIVPAAFPDKAWLGTVETVAVSPRQLVGQSKSYPVRIRLKDSANALFHTGMSCRAEISTRGSDTPATLAVPVQALSYEESTTNTEPAKVSVFVVREGRAVKREVETGTADDSHIEIVKGVEEGASIVVGPARTLRFLRGGDRVAQKDPDIAEAKDASKPATKP
jgi:HlyD family secretion protein